MTPSGRTDPVAEINNSVEKVGAEQMPFFEVKQPSD
jgi:hypothetical protein